MKTDYTLNAETRSDMGKGASRRLRRANKVPAVMYGAGDQPTALTVDHDELFKSLENEAFYSHILTINVDGKPVKAVLKDLQRHAFRPVIQHMDLLRVSENQALHMHVPLHFSGAEGCPGVKAGGLFTREINDVEVICLPKDLPEYIQVDVSGMNLNQILHLSDLMLPAGVQIVALSAGADHDLPVASIHMPRGAEEAAPAAPAAAALAAEGGTPAPAA